jgi:hypothetical protein
MKRFLRSKPILSLVALVILAGAILIPSLRSHTPAAHAASGDFVSEVTFSQDCQSGLGVGITYDGANLWYSCYASTTADLYRADPNTGTVTASYTIAGGLGSLAYDATHNAIWAGWGNSTDASQANVRLIQLDASKNVTGSSVKFQAPGALVCGLDDGIAYDATNDSLYLSDDCSTTIYHYSTTGVLLGSSIWAGAAAGSSCYNSGLGLGGNILYQGSDGCSHVYATDKTTPSGPVQFDFSTVVASDPNFRDEGLTCDPNTFASQGKQVMWSKEAYSPMRAHAYEIPAGSCGFGGQPATDFKQNEGPWANNHLALNNNCSTIAQEGCAVTAVADVLASYGLKLPDGTSVDPGSLNKYLATHNGFDGCAIFWGRVATSPGIGAPHLLFANSTTWQVRKQEIDNALANGDLPIVSVLNSFGGTHYIVLYQKVPGVNGAPDDYRILDPFHYANERSGKLLSQTYGPIQNFTSSMDVIHYLDGSHPGRIFVLTGHSPIQLLITDPMGTQTGFNPSTGTYVQNIAGTAYGLEKGVGDDPTLPPLPDRLYFQAADPINGTYTVQVIGTGAGPYSLHFSFADLAGNGIDQTITGTTAPGAVDTYLVTISSTSGQPVTIQRQVQIDVKPPDDPPSINPQSNGVLPVVILSTTTFDAKLVDPRSVRFGPKGVTAVRSSLQDVNGDGKLDLVLQFVTNQTGIASGDTQVCLTGTTTNGVSIVGCDTIKTTSLAQASFSGNGLGILWAFAFLTLWGRRRLGRRSL